MISKTAVLMVVRQFCNTQDEGQLMEDLNDLIDLEHTSLLYEIDNLQEKLSEAESNYEECQEGHGVNHHDYP